MGLYYRIWVDCIERARRQPANKENWQIGSMIFMTLAMAFNFILIMTILEKHVLKNYFYKIDFSFLPVRINNVLSYIFLFILPCIIINYLLIFRNKRYEKLIKKYPYYNGKLFITYFLISLMLPIALLLGVIIFPKL
jgi:hypothetical protein